MIRSTFGFRLLHEPRFVRRVLVLLAAMLVGFRLLQFAIWSTQVQWGYDFSFYWRAALALLRGQPIYTIEQLSGPYAPQGQDGFLYPPPFAAAMTPFAIAFPGDYRVAMWTWAALGALILATGAVAVARSVGLPERIRAATGHGPWILLVVVFGFPPVVAELVLGNVHILLFGLLTLGWLGIRRGDRLGERWAGIAVGGAAMIKVFPGLILLWFLLTRRWQGAAFVLVGILGATLLALPVTGVQPWQDYPTVLLNLSAPADTTDTLAPTVWLAEVIGFLPARVLVTAGAIGLVAWSARRSTIRLSFAVAVLASVLMAPALYQHYLAILVLPFLLLLGERGNLRWLALAYLLMSGGDQTALGDLSWVMTKGFPTAGALLLLALALRPAHAVGPGPSSDREAVTPG